MSKFVLIHGAWHGAWCWYKVVAELEKKGHVGMALDLPGHGRDHTPIADVSLDAYVNRVGEFLAEQDESVILVGHSMGGIVLSQVAENYPEKVRCSIYLAAFLLPNGRSLLDEAIADTDSLVLPNAVVNSEEGYVTFNQKALREVFYQDCSARDIALAKLALIDRQPLAPLATPIRITDERFGRVPRFYIETLQDRAITPSFQQRMYRSIPCQKIVSLNTSHSPFFSRPKQLTNYLIKLSREQRGLRSVETGETQIKAEAKTA